ncbi:MAG: hypothetical protein II578_04335, partial [Bacteroidaceae bacterium]|nr:hypothetical protein [Bacteroidaceae bacterium]
MKAKILLFITALLLPTLIFSVGAGTPARFAFSPAPDTLTAKDSLAPTDTLRQADSLGQQAASATQIPDSIPLRPYTILPDTTQKDTLAADTLPKSKSALDEPVIYSAEDSIT